MRMVLRYGSFFTCVLCANHTVGLSGGKLTFSRGFFIKIIFTTEPPKNLDFVAQGSAFEKADNEQGDLKKTSKEVEGVWGSILHTIVQRRA